MGQRHVAGAFLSCAIVSILAAQLPKPLGELTIVGPDANCPEGAVCEAFQIETEQIGTLKPGTFAIHEHLTANLSLIHI